MLATECLLLLSDVSHFRAPAEGPQACDRAPLPSPIPVECQMPRDYKLAIERRPSPVPREIPLPRHWCRSYKCTQTLVPDRQDPRAISARGVVTPP